MSAKIVRFPDINVGDIPNSLRSLADEIESGELGDAHSFTYVIDTGKGVEIGHLGFAAQPGVNAYYVLGLAMRKLEAV